MQGNKPEKCLAALSLSKALHFLDLLNFSSLPGPLMGLCADLPGPGCRKADWGGWATRGRGGGGEKASVKLLCHCSPCCSYPGGPACTFGAEASWEREGAVRGEILLSLCPLPPAGFARLG